MTQDEIIEAISEEFGLDPSEIKMDSALRELAADSLEVVSLAVELENRFGVCIDDDDWEKFSTVGDIVKHLEAV